VKLALLALAGCNSIFGIERTKALPHSDAQQFDGQPDAPFACPPTGTAPKFSVYFKQVVPQGDCDHYTIGGGAAVATCLTSVEVTSAHLDESQADAPMMTDVVPNVPYAMLSPDGLELWAVTTTGVLSVYTPAGADTWQFSYDAFTIGSFITATVPMPIGNPRRVLVSALGEIHELDELAPQVWQDFAQYQLLPTPGTVDSPPQISPDGLRVVFHGATGGATPVMGVYYADRANLSVPFNPAVLLVGPPEQAGTPFMTPDCSRIYFSGLGSVFYVPEELQP
jgi:hypothetical protein